jgi:hypothetical protein
MKENLSGRIRGYLRLMLLSAQLVAGRRFWIVILLPLLWPALQVFLLLVGWRQRGFEPVNAQALMGLPLAVIAIGLGVRVIANEIDRRTLEIAYTVPGGCHRIFLYFTVESGSAGYCDYRLFNGISFYFILWSTTGRGFLSDSGDGIFRFFQE